MNGKKIRTAFTPSVCCFLSEYKCIRNGHIIKINRDHSSAADDIKHSVSNNSSFKSVAVVNVVVLENALLSEAVLIVSEHEVLVLHTELVDAGNRDTDYFVVGVDKHCLLVA